MNPQDFAKVAGVEQMEAAMKASQETFDKAVKASKENAEKAYKASADAVTKGYDKAVEMTKEQVEKSFPQATEKFNEAADFGKGNMDAVFSAGAIASKGLESLAEEVAALSQNAFDANVSNTKALFSAKTPQEAMELQTTLARTSFDTMVAASTKVSELYVKVANEVMEPLQARTQKLMETYGKAAA